MRPQLTPAAPRILPPNVLHAVLIGLSAFVLLINCWDAPFLPVDDSKHVFNNKQVIGDLSLPDVFKVPNHSTYFPMTILSYRLDRVLFNRGSARKSLEWAQGIRLMNCVYHAVAALFLWRIFLALGLSHLQALCLAMIYAVHPLAAETVCWISERKSALSAMFGFAALLAYLRLEGWFWRMPLVLGLYALALMGKPNALGLLPVFFLLDVFFSGKAMKRHVLSSCTNKSKLAPIAPSHPWLDSIERLTPMAVLSAADVYLNIIGQLKTLVPPPGGSAATALLTDVEILVRYIFNVFAPVRLSFAYYIDPFATIGNVRLWFFSAILAAVCGGTLALAANRSRAMLGWLWFALALGPHLNLLALSQLMQDRYVCLSIPGFLLVLNETVLGISMRVKSINARVCRLAGVAYIVLLAALALGRGGLFSNMFELFADAVQKEPQSSYAQYGLALAYEQIAQQKKLTGEPTEAANYHRMFGEHCLIALNMCPDAPRQVHYARMALDAAEYCLEQSKVQDAERYFKLSADGIASVYVSPAIRSEALRNLADMKLRQGQADEAHSLADRAVRACPIDVEARYIRANTALTLLDKIPPPAARQERVLLDEAKADLESIAKEYDQYARAQQLLRDRTW